MSPAVITVLLMGSLAAGWVDAVVGGGGLILVPLVMILNPSFSNAQALGTNKVAAVFGTGSSAVTLLRQIPSAKAAFKFVPLALVGSGLGALIASSVDKQIMRPVIIVLLIAVGTFVLLRPSFGQTNSPTHAGTDAPDNQYDDHRKAFPTSPNERDTPTPPPALKRGTDAWRRIAGVAAFIGGIGVYDGAFGPGTGLFLIMGLTSLLNQDFLTSAAWAKILNVCTNFGALVVFTIQGEVLWMLGLALAVTNVIGAQIGARMVLGRGAGFVRAVILVVVVAMASKLALDQFGIMG